MRRAGGVLAFAGTLAVLLILGASPREAFAVPGNNNFASAITITTPAVSSIVATADTTGATAESGEPLTCSAAPLGATAWYTWTSPNATGEVIFDTFGISYDTVVGVYTGNAVNGLVLQACNKDFLSVAVNPSALFFSYAANTTYRIQVGGASSATGTMVLSMITGSALYVNTGADNNESDAGLSLRESILLVSGGTAALGRALNAGEAVEMLKPTAVGAATSDVIRFAPHGGFTTGSPGTITLGSELPAMNANNDVVSGVGAGVIVTTVDAAIDCFTITGIGNRVSGLDIRSCNTGIEINGGLGNRIGVDLSSPAPIAAEQNILRNNDSAIYIHGNPDYNVVAGNYVGTDTAGSSGLGNSVGIVLQDSPFNSIGVSVPLGRNVISGNIGPGLFLDSAPGNAVQNNYIGTNPAGTGALPNEVGMSITNSANNVVGGELPGERNVISGNAYGGIQVFGRGSVNNRIAGNHIGVNAAGTAPLANGADGIELNSASNNTIGGELPGERNVISGNGAEGIDIIGAATVPGFVGPALITDLTNRFYPITVAESYPIVDLDVTLNITHTNDADLNISLIPPSGPAIELSTDNGGGGDNYNGTTLDDEALTSITAGAAPFSGSFRPEAPLSAVDGLTAAGTWQLHIYDDTAGSEGTLNSWSLSLASGGNRVLGNYIGTNAAGTAGGVPNSTGIAISGGSRANIIGGLTAGARNVISGNINLGIGLINSHGNSVVNNYVGTNVFGTGPLANGSGGIYADGDSNNVQGNLVSGNVGNGIQVSGRGSVSNQIVGNFVGVNAAGTAPLSNGGDGIRVGGGASNNTIGGELPGERNVISGNAGSGIYVTGGTQVVTSNFNFPIPDLATFTYTSSVPISDPIVDLDVSVDITHTFDADLNIFLIPPVGPAIELSTDNGLDGDNYRVTTFDDEAPTSITAGVAPFNGSFRPETPLSALDGLSPNGSWGLQIQDHGLGDTGTLHSYSLRFSSGYNAVLGNYIGTNAAGTAGGVPNSTGITIDNSRANVIGGSTAGARNVISGNAFNGVQVLNTDSTDNVVLGNYIGTNAAGTAPIANGARGVEMEARRNTIGGTATGARNVISGNSGPGVAFEGAGTTENVVQGNYVGVGADGVTPIANGNQGVWFGSDSGGQTIGGTVSGAGNLIAHNAHQGIGILTAANKIYGNTVRDNGLDGIYVAGGNNLIGSLSVPGSGNVIESNGGAGLGVYGGSFNHIALNMVASNNQQGINLPSFFNAIYGNNIRGNGLDGVYVQGDSNDIALGNVITGNGGDGISIASGRGPISDNSISGNAGLGIDLAPDGVTPNDGSGDPDTGPNALQNFPVLAFATVSGGNTFVSSSLVGTSGQTFTIEYFHSDSCDATGNGEGEVYMGSFGVVTGLGGSVGFGPTFPGEVPAGRFITATARNLHRGGGSSGRAIEPSRAQMALLRL